MANKQEIKYILLSLGFALFWFIIALPIIIKTFDGNNPIIQFLLFNIGLLLFLQIFLKAKTLGKGINITGAIGLISLFLALDTMIPEYHVDITGQLIPGGILGYGTTDYIWGYLATNFVGLSGITVYILTYIVMPGLLLYIAAKLLPNFVREL